MTIGIDIGGTNLRAGLENEGQIIQQNRALLLEKESLDSTLKQLINLVKPLIKPEVKGLGIGVPSVVDVEKGIVYNVTNIPSWEEVPLKDILEKEFNLPVYINNDVNCFTLGEFWFGEAKGYHSIVGMAIGTGLGSGIIINNQLYIGHNGGAGEIGLLPYLDKTLEYFASGNFFPTYYINSAHEAFEAALSGDKNALTQWERFGHHIGKAVQIVVYTFDPQVIVIGGSVSKAYQFFKDSMFDTLENFGFPQSIKRLKILPSKNENIALLGAAALVHQHLQNIN
ncbi:ROK family protein [soil metagenome]